MTPCPCGRRLEPAPGHAQANAAAVPAVADYAQCCGRWHAGPQQLQAPDAPALMRSRYSAYVLGLPRYLLDTWHPSTRPPQLEPSAANLRWLGLEVLRHDQADATHASVEFVARYKQGGRAQRLHECSRFVFEAGRWYYVGGDSPE